MAQDHITMQVHQIGIFYRTSQGFRSTPIGQWVASTGSGDDQMLLDAGSLITGVFGLTNNVLQAAMAPSPAALKRAIGSAGLPVVITNFQEAQTPY